MRNQLALAFTTVQPFDPRSMAIAPSEHCEARETSAIAAIENAQMGRKAKQVSRILELLKAAGDEGLSDPEISKATGYSRQTVCARRGWDLRSLIEPAATRYTMPGSNRPCQRWKLRTA